VQYCLLVLLYAPLYDIITALQPVYLDATPTAPIMMDDPPTVADDNSADTGESVVLCCASNATCKRYYTMYNRHANSYAVQLLVILALILTLHAACSEQRSTLDCCLSQY
jgi:hypothetical protein